jgi:hypothetical protein
LLHFLKTRLHARSRPPSPAHRKLRLESLENRHMLSGAPPVLFAVNGSLWDSYYRNPSFHYSEFGENFEYDEALESARFTSGSARIAGEASAGRFEGTWDASMYWVSEFIRTIGIGGSGQLAVYVRGGPGTPYFFEYTESVFLRAQETGSRTANNSVYVSWRGQEISESSGYWPIKSHQLIEAGMTAGTVYYFDDYPDVPYSRVYFDNSSRGVHIWSNNGLGSGALVDAEAHVSASARAYIQAGVPPVATIEAEPPYVAAGQELSLSSDSYDPDNGSTRRGTGIISYKWEITGPNGITKDARELVSFVPTVPGKYTARLLVTDDEGMEGNAELAFEAVAPQLVVSTTLVDFGSLAWTAPAERTITIRNAGHPLTRLHISFDVDGSSIFTSNPASHKTIIGGDSLEVTIRAAPRWPAAGELDGQLTITSLDDFNDQAIVILKANVAAPIPTLTHTKKGPRVPAEDNPLLTQIKLHALHYLESSTGDANDLIGIKITEHLEYPDSARWFFALPPTDDNPEIWEPDDILPVTGGTHFVFSDGNGIDDARFWHSEWHVKIPSGISYDTIQTFSYSAPWTNGKTLPLPGGSFIITRTLTPPAAGQTIWTFEISKAGISDVYRLEGLLAYEPHWKPGAGPGELRSQPKTSSPMRSISQHGTEEVIVPALQRLAPMDVGVPLIRERKVIVKNAITTGKVRIPYVALHSSLRFHGLRVLLENELTKSMD